MCLRPIYVNIRPRVYQIDDFQGKSYTLPVPCGECAECLRKRQNQYKTRVLLNAQKYQYSYFLTLTYDNDTLPIYCRAFMVDKDTGELSPAQCENENGEVIRCSGIIDRSLPIWQDCRRRLNESDKNVLCQITDDYDYGYCLVRYVYTDSLDYSDTQKFLKRVRSSLSYRLGDSAPKMSYIVCGEYGPKTHRPHWHLVLMFDKPIENFTTYVKECWKFGFSVTEQIGSSKEDFSRVGSYISKYIVKGKANQEPLAKSGFCVLPRVRASIGFGSYLTPQQMSYLRCYDMFGSYSMFEYRNQFTDEQVTTLLQEMCKRFSCLFSSTSTSVTKSLLSRLFSVRTPSGNVCWSPLYLELRNFKRELSVSRNDTMYRQYCSDFGFTENSMDSFIAFDKYKETIGMVTETQLKKNSNDFYRRSKF